MNPRKKLTKPIARWIDEPSPPTAPERVSLSFTLSPELEPYEHDIRRFVDAMLYKLKVHSSKGRWEQLDLEEVLQKMNREVVELHHAVDNANLIEILLEAADVGNYAMIAASIAVERGK